jgi:DNA-binding beta-propeller fold protein YncE
VWAANEDGTVSRIDPASGQVTATITLEEAGPAPGPTPTTAPTAIFSPADIAFG